MTGEGVQVLYLDYGNHETVPVGALEVLPPSLMTQPTQVGRMVGLGRGYVCVWLAGVISDAWCTSSL